MDERAARVLGRHGYRTGGHRAHQITRDEIERADLVLAMEDIHVRRMLEIDPGADQSPTADRLRPRRRARQRDRRPVVRAGVRLRTYARLDRGRHARGARHGRRADQERTRRGPTTSRVRADA